MFFAKKIKELIILITATYALSSDVLKSFGISLKMFVFYKNYIHMILTIIRHK